MKCGQRLGVPRQAMLGNGILYLVKINRRRPTLTPLIGSRTHRPAESANRMPSRPTGLPLLLTKVPTALYIF